MRGWIQGALENLAHQFARGTIANVMRRCGFEPAPERRRRTRLSTFLKAHWSTLVASDFLNVEAWTPRGLLTYHVLFFISRVDRVVTIAGISASPEQVWMHQIGRNLTNCEDGWLIGKTHRIIDRNGKYLEPFRRLIDESATKAVRLPPRSPNLNAHSERFVRSIKDKRLNQLIFFGPASLRRALAQYDNHYHPERNAIIKA